MGSNPDLTTMERNRRTEPGSLTDVDFEQEGSGFDTLARPLGNEGAQGDIDGCEHDSNGNTQAHRAAAAGDVEQIQRLLENGCNIRAKNNFNVTPLHAAVLLGQLDVVDLLLKAGVPPADPRGPNNMTALHCAVMCKDPKPMILRLLEVYGYVNGGSKAEAAIAALEAEAKASEQAEAAAADADLQALCDRWSALEAEMGGSGAPQQQLLDVQLEQQEMMQRQQRRRHEQHEQLQAERLKRVEAAELEHRNFKTFIDSLDDQSQSALVLAINQGRAMSVEALVAAKASIWGRVHYAAHHGHNKMLKELLWKGCPADEPDEYCVTPIHKAARGGYADCVLTLLEAQADLHRKVPGSLATCILLSSAGKHSRHASAVGVLIDHGANLEDKDAKGNTPLLAACHAGNAAVLGKLLQMNVELDAVNEDLDSGFHLAARQGIAAEGCVRQLLEHQATQDLRNAAGETPYLSALLAGHTEMAQLLKEHGSNPSFQLHWAVENPCADHNPNGVELPNVTKLILAQTPVNLQDTKGVTALHAAARKGNEHAVLQLLESKANPQVASYVDGSTALIAASENGHLSCVKLLLSAQANVGAYTTAKRTALHYAARNGRASVVKQLLLAVQQLPDGCIVSSTRDDKQAEEDAKTLSDATITATLTGNLLSKLSSASKRFKRPTTSQANHPLLRSVILNAQDRGGTTAVALAAKYGCFTAVSDCIKAEADVHIPDYRGWSPLHHGAYHGRLDICRLLIAEAGAPIDQVTNNGETPLIFAANQNHMHVLHLLLLNEANIHAETAYGQSALFKAAENGHTEVIEHLIGKGADIEHQDVSGCTPLTAASGRNHLQAVELLLVKGAKVNPPPGSPGSALCSATQFAGVEVVGCLLKAGADPNYRVNGSPPLKFASQRGDLGMVKLLLDSPDVTVDSRDADEAPALHYAILEGHLEVVKELIRRGANVNSMDWKQSTPLTNAASTGQVEICKLLIDLKANVQHMTFGGVMAVHRAAQAGHIEVLKLFLLPLNDCILDKFVATSSGQTLMHIAASYGQTEVMRWLLFEVGLDINQTCQGQQLKRAHIRWKQWNRQSIVIQAPMVQSLTEDEGFEGPALAVHLLNNDRQLSYAEFEILEGQHPCNISFGIGVDNGRYDYMCGLIPETIGLNGLNGCILTGAFSTIKQYTHKFGKGDTIGLIYNPAFRTVSYTRNGVHLGTAAEGLTPGKQALMIGFGDPGIKLEANFFESEDYDYIKLFEASFDEMLMEEEQRQNPGNLAHPWKVKDRICPLHMAASSKSISSLKLLLDLGAVVDQKDADGWTAMHYAAIVGWDDGARLLLELGASPNVVSLFDSTPVLLSVKNSHAAVTKVLIDNGAELRCNASERDRKGRTLLMWAADTGNSSTIQMLLERDVSIKAKDKLGRTALQYACNEQVVTYLENALNQLHTYRGVFQISKQQEVTEGSAGKVVMAMHQVTQNMVAIKFYKDRALRDFSASVLRDLASAHRYIATLPRDVDPAELVFEDSENRIPGCPYALVIEGGVEDLSESMAKTGTTPMPENQIRYIFEQLAASVDVLHGLGRVHHDVKCANLVRFFDGTWRLVDLDNCRVAGVDKHGLTTLEILPPEIAKSLLNKTTHELKSDYSADMWALGCVLFEMVTHTQFLTKLKREWDGRRLDNSMLAEGLELLSNVQQSQVDLVIDNLQEKKKGRLLIELTSDLLRSLLKVDPSDRCTSQDVLWHSFLKGGTTATMEEKNLTGVRNTLNIVHNKVDQVLVVTTDIRERTVSIQALSRETRDGIASCVQKISGLRSLVMEVATRSEHPSTFSIGPDVPFKELLRPETEKIAALLKWLGTVKEVMVGSKTMADIVKLLVGIKHLRLALVCERCMEPQVSYRIEENPPFVARIMPAFQVGLQMVKLYNIGACVGKFFFPALPTVPSELVEKSQEFVDSLGFKSTAQDFKCIQETLDQRHRDEELGVHSEETKAGQQLGVSFRELGNFLDKHDPGRDWGGLVAVQTEEGDASEAAPGGKGGVLWVCKACLTNAQRGGSPAFQADAGKPLTPRERPKQHASPAKVLKSGLCGLSRVSSKVMPD